MGGENTRGASLQWVLRSEFLRQSGRRGVHRCNAVARVPARAEAIVARCGELRASLPAWLVNGKMVSYYFDKGRGCPDNFPHDHRLQVFLSRALRFFPRKRPNSSKRSFFSAAEKGLQISFSCLAARLAASLRSLPPAAVRCRWLWRRSEVEVRRSTRPACPAGGRPMSGPVSRMRKKVGSCARARECPRRCYRHRPSAGGHRCAADHHRGTRACGGGHAIWHLVGLRWWRPRIGDSA